MEMEMEIVNCRNKRRIETKWESASRSELMTIKGFINIEVWDDGISIAATGSLPKEGIEALEKTLAKAKELFAELQ